MSLKKFESFEVDNSKIWVVGIPSGEALQITRDDLDILYGKKIIFYDTQYASIGFFAFKDINVEEVKKYVKSKKKPPVKDIMIFDNQFERIVSETISDIVDQYPEKMELYISGDILGISYDPYYIEIIMNDESKPGKYQLLKRRKGVVVDKYIIHSDNLLITAIYEELYKKNQT